MIFRRDTIPNFLRALWRVACSWLFRSHDVAVKPEVYKARIAACNACDRLVPDSRQCMECTCFVDVKAMLVTESCPKKRW